MEYTVTLDDGRVATIREVERDCVHPLTGRQVVTLRHDAHNWIYWADKWEYIWCLVSEGKVFVQPMANSYGDGKFYLVA